MGGTRLPTSRRRVTLKLILLICLCSDAKAFSALHSSLFALTMQPLGRNQTRSTALRETRLRLAPAFADTFLKANPLVGAAIVCAFKAGLADLVAQSRNKNGKHLDVRRSASFIVYGALYQGCAQELIYNNFYTWLFGSSTSLRVAVRKVLFDAVFHNAMVCIPMAYLVKSFVFRFSPRTAIRQYIDDVMYHGLLIKYYAIWMPTNLCIFTVIPEHWRITVMACVSFFWMVILSTVSSRPRGVGQG